MKLTLSVGVVLLISGVPLMAQSENFTAESATAAYEEYASYGFGPETAYQIAECAGYWSEWVQYTGRTVGSPFWKGLPDHLKSQAAFSTMSYWLDRMVDTAPSSGDRGGVALSFERAKETVRETMKTNDAELMVTIPGMLGGCVPPKG